LQTNLRLRKVTARCTGSALKERKKIETFRGGKTSRAALFGELKSSGAGRGNVITRREKIMIRRRSKKKVKGGKTDERVSGVLCESRIGKGRRGAPRRLSNKGGKGMSGKGNLLPQGESKQIRGKKIITEKLYA